MAQCAATWAGPCFVGLAFHEAAYGPPPPGKRYACFTLAGGGAGPFSYVYCIGVPATYLVQTVHERSGVEAVTDDVEITTSHWRWEPATDPDASDFAVVEARLDGFWTEIAMARHPSVTVREHRWYPAVVPPASPGPTIHTAASGVLGTSTGGLLPPQVATTLTFITDVRRRWGRFYIGGLTTSIMSTAGRLNATDVSSIAAAGAEHFFNSATNWRVQVFGAPTPNSLPVRSVRCDDIFDIIRSRRYGSALARSTDTLDA